MENNSLQPIIEKLESVFSKLNIKFFAGKLQKPIITVNPNTNRNAYGWCTSWKAWKEGEQGGYYEINICAEYLSRPFADIVETMLHEAVHLFNLQEGIQDTSRSGTYHNKNFKAAAEAHGLLTAKHQKIGCTTSLHPSTAEWIRQSFNTDEGFTLCRATLRSVTGGNKKSSTIKYVCPKCGLKIRATKEVSVTCTNCSVLLEKIA